MKIGEFELINTEKVDRVLNGMLLDNGSKEGGIIKDDGSYDESVLLAGYDRLGGLIKKGNDKIKMGSFYDFRNKMARKTPEIIFVFKINGKTVEVKDGEEESNLVKAAKLLEVNKCKEEKVRITKKAKK